MHKTHTTSEINSWVSWYENSEYILDPVNKGLDKFLNGKNTCTDPPFVYTGNRVRFWNEEQYCNLNRLCAGIPSKRVAQVKISSVEKYVRTHVNVVLSV